MYSQPDQDVVAEVEAEEAAVEEVATEEAEEEAVMEETEREAAITMTPLRATIAIKQVISAGTAQTMKEEAVAEAVDVVDAVAITAALMTEHATTVVKRVIYRTIVHQVVAVVDAEVEVTEITEDEAEVEVEGGIEMTKVAMTIERKHSTSETDD